MKQVKKSEEKINPRNDELLKYLKPFWQKRKMVFIILFLSACLGVFVAVKSEKEYTASIVFIPQISDSDGLGNLGGNIGGLASLAGIDLAKSAGKDFPPGLYPDILRSVHVQLSLLNAPLVMPETKDEVTFRQYYEEYHQESFASLLKEYTIGLPGLLIKAIKGSKKSKGNQSKYGEFTRLSNEEFSLVTMMRDQISIITSLKEGFVSVSVNMPDPYLAAQMTKNLENVLREELIKYKTTNANAELTYVQERYNEKKKEFTLVQENLAIFRDRNKNLNTASARNRLDLLESEYNIAQDVYLNLARQLEQAKLQLTRNTPRFSVIKPVSVPTIKSGPNSLSTIFLFIFFGITISAGLVFLPGIYRDIKSQLNS